MRKIPETLKQDILADRFYERCALRHTPHCCGCAGRVTWEHAIIYAGRQLNEKWAIVPLCERCHGVNSYQDVTAVNKELSVWVALNMATDAELLAVSKATNYLRERDRLNNKYGTYRPYWCSAEQKE